MNLYLKGSFIWLLTGLFFLYEFFSRAFMGSMTGPLQASLALSPAEFSMIASAYYFAYSPLQIPVGLLMDRFGARILLTGGCLLCALGALLFSNAHSFESAWFSRFLMGMGSSVGFISLLTVSINWLPKRFFGSFAGMSEVLGMIGPILSGAPLAFWLLATNDDWRKVLLDVAIIGFVLAVLLFLIVRNRPAKAEAAFLKNRDSLSLMQRLKFLIRNKSVLMIALYAFFIYGGIPLLGEAWGTPYLQARGFSLTDATAMVAFLWMGMGFGSPLVGLLSDTVRLRKPVLALCAILGMVMTILFALIHSHAFFMYALLLFLIGVASGGQTLSFALLAESVPVVMQGTAMGFNNMAVMLGGLFSQSIAGLILNHFWSGGSESFTMLPLRGYQWSLGLVFGFFVAALLMCLFLRETYAKPVQ